MRKAPEGMSKLTDEVKAIKVANTRLRYLAKKYGTDSEIYQKAINPFLSKKFDAYRNESKGVLQLSTKLDRHYNRSDRALVFGYIRNIPTIAKVESHVRESLGISRDEWKKASTEDKTELAKGVYHIEENISTLIEQLYKAKCDIDHDFPELHKGKMTFEEAKSFVDKANRWLNIHSEYQTIIDELNKYDYQIVKDVYTNIYEPSLYREEDMFKLIQEFKEKGVKDLGKRKETPFD